MELRLGDRRWDLTSRALVMGILNRTPDSLWDLDRFVGRAEELVAAGADLLDVGGAKAGPGREVGEAEELDRVVPAVAALVDRLGVPVSVDTCRASVAAEAYRVGAVMGNDVSGFADPGYLPAAAAAGAAVVATHIRRPPDPDPSDDVVGEVAAFLAERVAWARAAGIAEDRIVVDAGLDVGEATPQSVELFRGSERLAALGVPLLLSASDTGFLGELFGPAIDQRRDASIAAHAVGVCLGCRILRARDVAAARRVADTLAAVMAAP